MAQKLHPLYGDYIEDKWVARAIPGPAGVYEGMAPSIASNPTTGGWTAALEAGKWRTAGDADHGRYLIEEDDVTELAIGAPNATYSRIDLIIGIHQWIAGPEVAGTLTPSGEFSADQHATYAVVAGTPAASPVAPTILDPYDGSKRAVVLAQVLVPVSGTPAITRMNDMRFESFANSRDEVVRAREGYPDLQAKIDSLVFAAATAVPTGTVLPFAAAAAPSGFLLCNGAAVSRSTYSVLFNLVGTTFGMGDGSSTFNLPNLTGRFPLGVSGSHALGSSGGEETHTLTIDEMPTHEHPTYTRTTTGDVLLNHDGSDEGDRGVYSAKNDVTGDAGGGYPHNTMPPFLSMSYIIKT